MWAEFVVGSPPCSEWFSPGTPGFPSLQKETLPNSNSIWNALTSLKQVFKNSYFVHVIALFVNKLQLQGCCCEVVMSAVGYLKLKLEVQVL